MEHSPNNPREPINKGPKRLYMEVRTQYGSTRGLLEPIEPSTVLEPSFSDSITTVLPNCPDAVWHSRLVFSAQLPTLTFY